MKRIFFTLLSLAGLLAVTLSAAADITAVKSGIAVIRSKQAQFDAVRENIVMAIENRGVKIDHESFIADMLERTGKDIGATKKVYGHADQIQFCKADLSRAMMEADPQNMVYCPFIISLYTLPGRPDTVHVAYRKLLAPSASPATRKALDNIEKMLDEIVVEGLQ